MLPGRKRQDCLALERLPVELVDFFAPDQHESVGRSQSAKDRNLRRRVAVLDIDDRLRSEQRNVRAVGEECRHSFVATLRRRQRDIETRFAEEALGQRHIRRRVQNGVYDLAVANLNGAACLARAR